MSETDIRRATVSLGEIQAAGSRGMRTRSAVALVDGRAIAGTVGGRVRAVSLESGDEEEWETTIDDEYVVSISGGPDGTVAIGGRGENGFVGVLDTETGDLRWGYRSADDVGDPQRESLFFLPYVVGVVSDGNRVYAVARRYERDGENRAFESMVYAFDRDGSVVWTYRADASPISFDLQGKCLAVAYNRCPGDHQCGLVVLDTETGDERLTWDPGTAGDRRVGDVSLLAEGVAVASHGDYRGYRLGSDGNERWVVDLACPVEIGEETLYAYPNHVLATEGSVVFVTGNTYPEEGRESEGRHSREHTISAFGSDGTERWHAALDGWASELAADAGTIAVPCAQHLRDRDPTAHGLRLFDLVEGRVGEHSTEGVATAAALGERYVAGVEEPVEYHDGTFHGEYRLHVFGR